MFIFQLPTCYRQQRNAYIPVYPELLGIEPDVFEVVSGRNKGQLYTPKHWGHWDYTFVQSTNQPISQITN